MGGSGAKNRRKLQRQQQEEGSAEKKSTKKAVPFQKTVNPNSKQSPRRDNNDDPTKRRRGDGLKKKYQAIKKGENPPAKKKKGFQKPKHLKRKLETAEEQATKEKLLQEIQTFESKKTLHSTQPSKKQKVERSDENAAPKEHVEEEAFPRSKDPAVDVKKPEAQSAIKKKKTKEDDDSDSDSSSDSSSDSDNSSDGEDATEQQQQEETTRTRGRRRRGRKSTSQRIEEEKPEPSKPTNTAKDRYCVGRKPVTDFLVGQSYPGKVVYMKPFGVFFDIGCHSDAFCHISRLSDDYVERPEELFQEGQEVPAVRIVEVDRTTKRLTASLQSEARKQDEHASIQARKERKEKVKKRKGSASGGGSSHPKPFEHKALDDVKDKQVKESPQTNPPPTKPESEMTPAELKRARKIARRAARRAEQEAE